MEFLSLLHLLYFCIRHYCIAISRSELELSVTDRHFSQNKKRLTQGLVEGKFDCKIPTSESPPSSSSDDVYAHATRCST